MSRRRSGPPKIVVVIGVLVGLAIVAVTFKDQMPVIESLFGGTDELALEKHIYQISLDALKQRINKPSKAKFLSLNQGAKDVQYDAKDGIYVVDSWFRMANHFDALEETRFISHVALSGDEPYVLTINVHQGGYGRDRVD